MRGPGRIDYSAEMSEVLRYKAQRAILREPQTANEFVMDRTFSEISPGAERY